jgi:hypothetical protein
VNFSDVHDVMLSAHPLFYEKPLELFSELCGSSFRVLSTEEMQVKLKEEYGNDLPLVVYEGNNCLVGQ